MTNDNKLCTVEQGGAASGSHCNGVDDTNDRDHTSNVGISLDDANDSQIDLNIDRYDVEYLLRPGAATEAIATGAAIVVVFLVALVTATGATAVAIIAVALASCLCICRKRERTRVRAAYVGGLEPDVPERALDRAGHDRDSHEAELDT